MAYNSLKEKPTPIRFLLLPRIRSTAKENFIKKGDQRLRKLIACLVFLRVVLEVLEHDDQEEVDHDVLAEHEQEDEVDRGSHRVACPVVLDVDGRPAVVRQNYEDRHHRFLNRVERRVGVRATSFCVFNWFVIRVEGNFVSKQFSA